MSYLKLIIHQPIILVGINDDASRVAGLGGSSAQNYTHGTGVEVILPHLTQSSVHPVELVIDPVHCYIN